MQWLNAYFADAGDPGVDIFATIDILDSAFPEEEVYVVSDIEGTDKIGFY